MVPHRPGTAASLLPRGGFLGAQPENTFVARETELARTLAALTAAEHGAGRLVLLAGEPGVGKTRLAQEVSLVASRRGFRVLTGRCYEQQTSLPFFPFTEALGAAYAGAPEALATEVVSRWPELARILPDLPPVVLDDADARPRVLRAATGFLRMLAADAPLALLLDDLHWADSASLDLLLACARHLRADHVLLLGTFRDVEVNRQHPLEAALRDLRRERLVDVVVLRGLATAGTAALIRAHLDVDKVSADLVDLVHAHTEGNPFFAEEVLRALVEQGAIFQDEQGAWSCKDLAEIDVPPSVRSVVGQRVSRLAPEAQDLLRAATVLGQEFELEVLLAVTGETEEHVLAHLDAALDLGLLRERRVGRGDRYAFAHALIRQTLYEEMRAHHRRRLHLRAGEAIERSHGERAEAGAVLARHYLEAGDVERAARYAVAAGDHAVGLFAYAEAAAHYRDALDLLSEQGAERGAAEARRKLALVLWKMDRSAQAVTALRETLQAYERLGDTLEQARIHRQIAWIQQTDFDFVSAAPHLEAALRLWPVDRRDAEFGHLRLDLARVKAFTGAFADAEPLAEESLVLAEHLDAPELQVRALIEVSLIRGHQGIPAREHLPLLNQAERLARASGDPGSLEWLHRVYANRGTVRSLAGDLVGARNDFRHGVEHGRAMRLPRALAFHNRNLAEVGTALGDWAEAAAAAREAADLQPDALRGQALLAWLEGNLASAVHTLRAQANLDRTTGDLQGLVGALSTLADWALQRDRAAEAEEQAREAVELVRTHGYWARTGEAYPPLAEAAVLQESPDAATLIADARARIERHQQESGLAQLLRAHGLLRCGQGDLAGAAEALQASARVARSQGALVQLARTLKILADVARLRGASALADEADHERTSVVERIGSACRGLAWAQPASPHPATSRPVSARSAPAAPGRFPDGLTSREVEVLRLLVLGHSNAQIAAELVLSVRTVERHLANIYAKIGAHGRADTVAYAFRHGLA